MGYGLVSSRLAKHPYYFSLQHKELIWFLWILLWFPEGNASGHHWINKQSVKLDKYQEKTSKMVCIRVGILVNDCCGLYSNCIELCNLLIKYKNPVLISLSPRKQLLSTGNPKPVRRSITGPTFYWTYLKLNQKKQNKKSKHLHVGIKELFY